jgi:hypothetical protein
MFSDEELMEVFRSIDTDASGENWMAYVFNERDV